MTRLHLDFETYSECDLKACGAFKYAEHPSTEILVACFAFDDEEVQTWVPGVDGPVPQRLREHIESGATVCAHNFQFERVIANGVAGKKVGFPSLTIEQGCCTAVKARAHGLPGGLSDVAKALGTHLKNDAGRGVMMQLVKPKKATKKDPSTRYTRENAPDKFEMLLAYCQDDVRAERGVDRALPDLTASERKVWELDARINEKGVLVDLARVEDIRFLIAEYRKELREECLRLTYDMETGGIEPTQRGKLADWIRLNGWPQLLDMQAETVKTLLENPQVPKLIKQVLTIYSTYGMKAVAKFEVMVEAACADGRVKGMFIMNGAGPGRWSSVLLQLQNMARGHIDDPLVAIEACRMRDLAWIKALYPKINPMKVFASCVRGMLVAAPGKKLVSFDFAGIESRKGAWLADENWKLEAFRSMDAGTGPDLYVLAYARAFRILISAVTKKMRQVGKVMELALGYEGGVGAFVTMTKTYGVKLDELTEALWPILPQEVKEQAEWLAKKGGTKGLDLRTFIAIDSLKRLWRANHPAQTQLWKDLKEAMVLAMKNPGSVFGTPNKKIKFCVQTVGAHTWLYMKLPSGRKIAYFDPRLETPKVKCRVCNGTGGNLAGRGEPQGCEVCDGSGMADGEPVPTYMGIDTDTRRWMRVTTYGGKTLENGDQGSCACLLRAAMIRVDAEFYDSLIMTVHDELVLEVDETLDCFDRVHELMVVVEGYVKGLPIAAEGWQGREYQK